ncbi:MAG: polyphosphate polymerase domain-containing protein [Clostridium sp.]|uniref:polyphosphate polymerase domain-containing protein n=1 Tax=Clostridium sp. TaxID=1506 RepID=UPI002FCC2714
MEYRNYDGGEALKVSRREMKYFIGIDDYFYFKDAFSKVLSLDSHSENGPYMVRSLYFDSIDNIDYHDKIDGIENRKKIRLRVYSPHDRVVKLEVKYKFNQNQRKESIFISRDDAKAIINGEYSVLLNYQNEVAQKVYSTMISMVYTPRVLVQYKREAFYHPEYGIRATLDTEISSSELEFDIFSEDICLVPVFDFTKPVLEVKYDKYIYKWFQEIVSSRSCTVSSISKYCNSRQLFSGFF